MSAAAVAAAAAGSLCGRHKWNMPISKTTHAKPSKPKRDIRFENWKMSKQWIEDNLEETRKSLDEMLDD